MTPVETSQKKNENIVWKNLYGIPQAKQLKPKFSVNDRIRISRKNGIGQAVYP